MHFSQLVQSEWADQYTAGPCRTVDATAWYVSRNSHRSVLWSFSRAETVNHFMPVSDVPKLEPFLPSRRVSGYRQQRLGRHPLLLERSPYMILRIVTEALILAIGQQWMKQRKVG